MSEQAIQLHFDNESTNKILYLWKLLDSNGINCRGLEKNHIPHLTLCYGTEINSKGYDIISTYIDRLKDFSLSLNSVCSFAETGILYLSPVNTGELLNLHTEIHNSCIKYISNPSALYFPNNWVPHCALASRLNQNELHKAFAIIFANFKKLEIKVNSISVAKYPDFTILKEWH